MIVAGLTYHLLHPNQRAWDSELIDEAYRCWRRVWSDTLEELDGVTRISSDQFTRQHEIGALFLDKQCIGLSTFRFVDLRVPCMRDDSYFEVWPETALKALVRDGPHICIGSQLTVAPEWRRGASGLPVKDLLLGLAVQRFLESRTNTMTGLMRNNRNMNELAYRLGAEPLMRGSTLHGVEVDLVAFRRHRQMLWADDPKLQRLQSGLWERARKEMHNEENVA
ncbi:MAG: hypothetical protein WBV82_01695 [Myxococcaceae bacterium]